MRAACNSTFSGLKRSSARSARRAYNLARARARARSRPMRGRYAHARSPKTQLLASRLIGRGAESVSSPSSSILVLLLDRSSLSLVLALCPSSSAPSSRRCGGAIANQDLGYPIRNGSSVLVVFVGWSPSPPPSLSLYLFRVEMEIKLPG